MAVFRVQVFYQRGEGDKWSNVYHLESADIPTAMGDAVTTMAPILTGLLHSSCRLVKILVSSLVDDTFSETVLNSAGTSAFSDSMIPFFNSVKIFFQPSDLGRPDYKFFKGWLTEALNDSGQVTSLDLADFVDALQNMISDMADTDSTLVSENGSEWTTAIGQPAIQMRQMHRKRRHVTP